MLFRSRTFALRAEFDRKRDIQEKELLRDALLLDDSDRAERTKAMFREELENFEAQVAKAPHMPRLILFDGK